MADAIDYGSHTEVAGAPAQRISPSFNGKVPGLITAGNIDLSRRPDVANPDGSHSTVRSMSFEDNGKEVLVPTVVGNKVVSDEEAIQHYRQTGEHLGIFDKPDSATAYARQLHDDYQSGKIKNTPPVAIDYGAHALTDQSNGPEQGVAATISQYWQKINPVNISNALVHAAAHPVDTLKEYGADNQKIGDAAVDAFKKGDYATGLRHSISYLAQVVPGVGKRLDEAGNKVQSGDYSGAIADTGALATQIAAGAIGPKVLDAATEPGAGAAAVNAVVQPVKNAASAVSNAATSPIALKGAGALAGGYLGHQTGIPEAGLVGAYMGRQVGSALAGKFNSPLTEAVEELKPQSSPVPQSSGPPPLPYEATAQGLTDAANQRMLSSMKASQTMAQAAQRAVPPAPAPETAPVEDMALLNATAKNTWNVPFSKLGRAAQDLIRNAVAKDAAKAAESSAQATPPAPAPQQVPVTQPAVSPEEAPTAAPSVTPTAAEEFAQAVMGKQEGGTIPAKNTAPAETFIDRARAAKSVKVNLLSKHMNDVGMTPEKLDELKPSQWRDIAQSAGVELPKDLTATIRDVRQALIDKNDPFVNVAGRGQVRLSTLKPSEKVLPMVNQ